jgi:hypothetical protein
MEEPRQRRRRSTQNYLCETGSHNKRRNTLSDLHQVLDDMAKRLSVRTRRFPLLETGDP